MGTCISRTEKVIKEINDIIDENRQYDDIPDPPKSISTDECTSWTYPISRARCIDVYDGDTITICTYISINNGPLTLYNFSCRIDGIDTPEIRGETEDEIELALLAKKYLERMILGKIVILKDHKKEKYGRVLATVYLKDGTDVGDLMIKKRYAVKYDGGTKVIPRNWMTYYKTGKL